MAAVNVAGQESEQIEKYKDQLQRPQNFAFDKNIDQEKSQIHPKQRLIQLVIAVAPIHKADQLICKFHVDQNLSCEMLPTVYLVLVNSI